MTTSPFFSWFMTVMALIILGLGCSTAPDHGSVIYYNQPPKQTSRSIFTTVEDTLVLTRIKTKLFSDDLVDQGEIDISVRHGVVFLKGNARDIYHRRMITDLIQTVEGVIRIESRLGMIHQGATFVSSETLVRNQIQMSLLNDPELSPCPITVKATASQIILFGSVGSQSQKKKAAAMAKAYAGDRQVIDQLRVKN